MPRRKKKKKEEEEKEKGRSTMDGKEKVARVKGRNDGCMKVYSDLETDPKRMHP